MTTNDKDAISEFGKTASSFLEQARQFGSSSPFLDSVAVEVREILQRIQDKMEESPLGSGEHRWRDIFAAKEDDASEQIRLLKEGFEALTIQVSEIRLQLEEMNRQTPYGVDYERISECLLEGLNHVPPPDRSDIRGEMLITRKRPEMASLRRCTTPNVTPGQYVWMRDGEHGTACRMLCTGMTDTTLYFDEVDEEGNLFE